MIAEIGVNHNGDLELAKHMIDAAATSDVDIIKFQTAVPELVQIETAPKAKYQTTTTDADESAMDMIASLQFRYDEFRDLKDYVESRGKQFLSTAFDLESLEFLSSLGLTLFKIPSGEITNLPYLRSIARLAEDIILSTGMGTMEEVTAAVDAIVAAGFSREHLTVLQCNTAYPSPISDTNLLAMVAMGKELGVKFGYSDHTQGSSASIAAVALGATVIEKHFTTDTTLPGPDQHASMEPEAFAALVTSIREVESALGSSKKAITDSERENRPIARRGVYASRDLPAGEAITMADIVCLRPETELSPMDIDAVLGRKLTSPVGKHTPIDLDKLSP
ncbi:MAG TPA: N-acetylneuraminate synthase [Terrimesophilobacter sp.]|nr:N-acetylneuraminate synthase [Terrimesophilobacter sp.]